MNTSHFDLSELPVGDIVAQNYHAAGIFRKYGIDFCCGGGISLEKACQKKNADLEQVTSELRSTLSEATSSSDNYTEWTPDFLIDYIINTHHRFVRKKSDEIAAYANKVAHVHGGRHPENISIYEKFIALASDMAKHLDAEETVVFPIIKKVYQKQSAGEIPSQEDINQLQEQLSLMEEEHEAAGDLMRDIRSISHDFTPPQDACTTYRVLYQNLEGFESDLHKHVHLENNILFKKAAALLPMN